MAKTFTFNGTCSSSNGSYYTCTLRVTTTAGTAAQNYSTVTSAEFIVQSEKETSVTFNGLKIYLDNEILVSASSKTVSFKSGEPVVLLSTSGQTISHNVDGTGTAQFAALVQASSGTYAPGVITINGTATLETIDRCATISSIQVNGTSNSMQSESSAMVVNGTNKPKVNWSQKVTNAGFTYKIQYFFQNTSSSAVSATSSPFSGIDVPTSWLSQIPNSTVARGRADLITYSGSTKIGTKSAYFYLKVPDYTPTASHTLTYSDQLGGYNVQGKTKVSVAASGSTSYSATIASYSTSIAGVSYSGSSVSSVLLSSSGTVSIVTTVTDSRGKTATKSSSITVYPYSAPSITLSAFRSNSSGTADGSGAYGKASAVATYSAVNGANTPAVSIKLGSTAWASGTGSGTSGSYTLNASVTSCSTTTSYTVTATITDDLGGTATATAVIPSVMVPINMSKTGVGIGASAPSAGLSIGYSNIGIGTIAPSSTGVLISAAANPTTIQSTKVGIGCAAPSEGITIGTSSISVEITKGGGLGYDYANGGVIFPATNWVPSKDNTYSLGSASKKWTTLQTTKINGVETATYLNNLSFARVPISSFSIASGIGTWTSATGATTNCFVRAMRGDSLSSAGSSWYIPDAWCSADNTIKVIFQTATGGSSNPTSGYVMVLWQSR